MSLLSNAKQNEVTDENREQLRKEREMRRNNDDSTAIEYGINRRRRDRYTGLYSGGKTQKPKSKLSSVGSKKTRKIRKTRKMRRPKIYNKVKDDVKGGFGNYGYINEGVGRLRNAYEDAKYSVNQNYQGVKDFGVLVKGVTSDVGSSLYNNAKQQYNRYFVRQGGNHISRSSRSSRYKNKKHANSKKTQK